RGRPTLATRRSSDLRYARIADFSVYVWTVVGIVAIEGNGIKRGRKALCRHSFAHIVKPAVRSFRPAFSGEHTGGVFGLPLEGIDSRSIGEFSGHIFPQVPPEDISPALIPGHGDLGYLCMR